MKWYLVIMTLCFQAVSAIAWPAAISRDSFPPDAPRFNLRLDMLNALLLSIRVGGEYAITPRSSLVVDGAHSYLKSRANAAGSRTYAEVNGRHLVVAYRKYRPSVRAISPRLNPNFTGLFWSAGLVYYHTSFYVKRDNPRGGYFNYRVNRAGLLGGGGYQLAFKRKWGLEWHASTGPALQFYRVEGDDFFKKGGPGLGLLVTPFHKPLGWILETGVHLTYTW